MYGSFDPGIKNTSLLNNNKTFNLEAPVKTATYYRLH